MASKKRQKINYSDGDYYSEGDCFVFPLTEGGFARGVIARHDLACDRPIGAVLGYFFSPIYNMQSEAVVLEDLKCENAIFVKIFSDLGLIEDRWKIIGKVVPWIKEDWPVPIFGQVQLNNLGELRRYDERTLDFNPSLSIRVSASEAMAYPQDGFAGHRFIEGKVSMILHNISQ